MTSVTQACSKIDRVMGDHWNVQGSLVPRTASRWRETNVSQRLDCRDV